MTSGKGGGGGMGGCVCPLPRFVRKLLPLTFDLEENIDVRRHFGQSPLHIVILMMVSISASLHVRIHAVVSLHAQTSPK